MAGTADVVHGDFDAYVAAVTSSLLRTAYLMAGDLAEAEDAVQETLFQIARRWPRVRKMDRPLAYARRTLVNLIIDGTPRRSRRQAELTEWTSGHGLADRGDEAAERAMQAVDARFDVAAALAGLPPRQRAIVVLRYWADMPEVDVAAALGCSVGTVKSTASRALARLREQLSSPLGDSSPAWSAGTASASCADRAHGAGLATVTPIRSSVP
jgi:RNA polymerase sigma-70 factor (sigma-E family)